MFADNTDFVLLPLDLESENQSLLENIRDDVINLKEEQVN